MSGRARVRIIATPPGEAPQWVREKWVGLELPLAQRYRSAREHHGYGVLTGPRTIFGQFLGILRGRSLRERGYAVRVLDAVAELERASPEAAAWWRTTLPHRMKPWRCFLFQESVCQVLDGADAGIS